jgi:hypothetical protein
MTGPSILPGSLRKYIALTHNGGATPITSLRYFAALLDEVRQNVDLTGEASDEIRVTK